MRAFKLLSGQHNQDGRQYEPGDVVHTVIDLPKLFPFMFEEIFIVPAEATAAPAPQALAAPASEGVAPPPPNVLDVTSKFPLAIKLGVLVHKYLDKSCKILDATDLEVLNEDVDLKTKNQISTFLKSLAPVED